MTGMVDLRAGYGSREFGKAELQLTRNGANVLHLEKEADNRAKHWGAPTRTLHVGSGQRLPAGRILLPTRKQWAAWGGAAAVGTAGLGGVNQLNRRKKVAKRNDDRRRTAASTALGAAGGVGVTDVTNRVGGWATREGIKYHEQLVNAGKIKHPMSRKGRDNRLKAHKAEHGVGSNVNDAPQSYYRNWPKELPGARARQFMGVKNTPKVVAATLTAGGLVGGAYGAHRSRIRKSYLPRAGGWVKASEVPKSRLRAGANSRYAARVRESDQTERERTHINRTVDDRSRAVQQDPDGDAQGNGSPRRIAQHVPLLWRGRCLRCEDRRSAEQGPRLRHSRHPEAHRRARARAPLSESAQLLPDGPDRNEPVQADARGGSGGLPLRAALRRHAAGR
jgi:hypothetical protein